MLDDEAEALYDEDFLRSTQKIRPPWPNATATRWASNHDWCFRGDNTKSKVTK